MRLTPPPWAKALIVAEFNEDVSDLQTDYFAHRTTKTVALAWSRHTRDLFPEMRKAAYRFSGTAHLTDEPPSIEQHREKYLMGGGYYLKAGDADATGWRVRKYAYRLDEIDVQVNLTGAEITRGGTTP